MNANCAKCSKTVYPVEKFQALGNTYHKACFKCTECNMTLNLNNYVASPDKQPYCKIHVPKATATAVAETPESRRIAEVTKNLSKAAYTADYEKNKAQFTAVAETPELASALRNTRNQSGVTYNQIRDRDVMGAGAMHNPANGSANNANSNNGGASVSGHAGVAADSSMALHDGYNAPQPSFAVLPTASVSSTARDQHAISVHEQQLPKSSSQHSGLRQLSQQFQQQQLQQLQHQQQEAAISASQQQQQASEVQENSDNDGGEKYRANYTYAPDADDELTFEVGDEIVNAKLVSEGWLLGTHSKTGKVGLFPEPYVQLC